MNRVTILTMETSCIGDQACHNGDDDDGDDDDGGDDGGDDDNHDQKTPKSLDGGSGLG